MSAALPTIGFIGTGSMGEPMVESLHRAGYPLVVFDADTKRAHGLAGRVGGKLAKDCTELAAASDVIITMLPTSAIVESVLQGKDGKGGVLAGLKPGATVIEMSSGVPAYTLKLAALVAQAGGVLVDAPVSGGVPRAKTAQLAIMFGGTKEVLQKLDPILKSLGSTVTHTGDVGSAHAMKALNNLVSAGGFLIGVEALLIGKRFGLDPDVMVDVLNSSTGMNNSTQKKFKQFVLSRQFNSGFGLDLMVKDISIAMGMADDNQTPVPFARMCRELWASAGQVLGKGQDHTDIARFAEKLAGTSLDPAEGK